MSRLPQAEPHNFATVPLPLTPAEVGERARAIYIAEILSGLSHEDNGKFLTIDIFSHAFELGEDDNQTLQKLRERYPEGRFYSLQVGQRVFGRL